jgi:hypothetical protein
MRTRQEFHWARNFPVVLPVVVSAIILAVLFPAIGFAQQAGTQAGSACPNQPPGVYIQGTDGWHALSSATPYKTKAAHGFLSSMTDGAVAARIKAEYRGAHAAVQVQGARPTVCISHIITPAEPIIIRLREKKNDRELDGGKIRALPVTGQMKMTKAESSIVVPATTDKSANGITLVHPQANLAPGEYAVMFGPTTVAIFDFGVDAAN